MRIQIDIGHPGHVHLFKNFAWRMQERGHEILFTCRDKEFEIYLLEEYGFRYKSFGKKYKKLIGKLFGLLKFDIQSIMTAFHFKPDIFMSHGSMYVAHASFFFRKPHLSFEDTFNMEQVKLYSSFTEVILVNDFEEPPLKSDNIIPYNGYHELAYLHPNWFTPNSDIFEILKLEQSEPYIILRFVSWDASHDVGQGGLTLEYKEKLINTLAKKIKIFISSEGELPDSLKPYQIKIPPPKMHDVLAFATLFIGEGATMASECAMLGTPSIYINTLDPLTIKEQGDYGLNFDYRNADGLLEKAVELLNQKDLKEEFKIKKEKLLSEKIDITAFTIWFTENYPQSHNILKETPAYQLRFK
jgi:predicted glycosyltransferase